MASVSEDQLHSHEVLPKASPTKATLWHNAVLGAGLWIIGSLSLSLVIRPPASPDLTLPLIQSL